MDNEMLEALSLLFKQQEKRLDEKFEKQRTEIIHEVKVLLDTEVTTKFNLLAEGQEEILRRMATKQDLEDINGRLYTLEAVVREHSREIEKLKKAN